MKILISACLLGIPCRYDGLSRKIEGLDAFEVEWVAFCPEVAGGLPTPRPPAEIIDAYVRTMDGCDVTREFQKGAQYAVQVASQEGITLALLKARSPSCGKDMVYDGTFTSTLISGMGISARALRDQGIEIYTEEELGHLDRALARRRQSDQNT